MDLRVRYTLYSTTGAPIHGSAVLVVLKKPPTLVLKLDQGVEKRFDAADFAPFAKPRCATAKKISLDFVHEYQERNKYKQLILTLSTEQEQKEVSDEVRKIIAAPPPKKVSSRPNSRMEMLPNRPEQTAKSPRGMLQSTKSGYPAVTHSGNVNTMSLSGQRNTTRYGQLSSQANLTVKNPVVEAVPYKKHGDTAQENEYRLATKTSSSTSRIPPRNAVTDKENLEKTMGKSSHTIAEELEDEFKAVYDVPQYGYRTGYTNRENSKPAGHLEKHSDPLKSAKYTSRVPHSTEGRVFTSREPKPEANIPKLDNIDSIVSSSPVVSGRLDVTYDDYVELDDSPPVARSPLPGDYGFRGLRNTGNSCFMNAVLQSLSSFSPFVLRFISVVDYRRTHYDNVSCSDETFRWRFPSTFLQKLCEILSLCVSSKCKINRELLTDFRDSCGKRMGRHYSSGSQQDAQEFLAQMVEKIKDEIDGLISNDDCGTLRAKPKVEIQTSAVKNNGRDVVDAQIEESENVSPVVKRLRIVGDPNLQETLLETPTRASKHAIGSPPKTPSTVRKANAPRSGSDSSQFDNPTVLFEMGINQRRVCKTRSCTSGQNTLNVNNDLQLSVNGMDNPSIEKLISQRFEKEFLEDFTCECGSKKCWMVENFDSLPECLIVVVKRYTYDGSATKCEEQITVNRELFLGQYLTPPDIHLTDMGTPTAVGSKTVNGQTAKRSLFNADKKESDVKLENNNDEVHAYSLIDLLTDDCHSPQPSANKRKISTDFVNENGPQSAKKRNEMTNPDEQMPEICTVSSDGTQISSLSDGGEHPVNPGSQDLFDESEPAIEPDSPIQLNEDADETEPGFQNCSGSFDSTLASCVSNTFGEGRSPQPTVERIGLASANDENESIEDQDDDHEGGWEKPDGFAQKGGARSVSPMHRKVLPSPRVPNRTVIGPHPRDEQIEEEPMADSHSNKEELDELKDEVMDLKIPTPDDTVENHETISPVGRVTRGKAKERKEAKSVHRDVSVIVVPVVNDQKDIYFKPIESSYSWKLMSELNLPKTGERTIENWRRQTFGSTMGTVIPQKRAPKSTPVSGDGNCLFRTLSWYLCAGDDSNFDVVRQRICTFMKAFKTRFVDLVIENAHIDDHLESMRSDGEWGTSAEIFAAATLLKMPIYSFHNEQWMMYHPRFEYSGSVLLNDMCFSKDLKLSDAKLDATGAIYITNPSNIHFDPVISTKRAKNTTAQKVDDGDYSDMQQFGSEYDNAPQLDHFDFNGEHQRNTPTTSPLFPLERAETPLPTMPAHVYSETEGPVYTLTGIVIHHGASLNSGHYTAYTFSSEHAGWLLCNDSSVNRVTEQQVLQEGGKAGYIFMYRRRHAGDLADFECFDP